MANRRGTRADPEELDSGRKGDAGDATVSGLAATAESEEQRLEERVETTRRAAEEAEGRHAEAEAAARKARQRGLEEAKRQREDAERRERALQARQAELELGKKRLDYSKWVQFRSYQVGGVLLALGLSILAVLASMLGQDLGLVYRTRLIATLCFSAGAFIALAAAVLGPRFADARKVQREEESRAREAAADAAEELGDAADLPALIKANRKQMEAYDVLARGQARTAFRNTQVAMAIGLLVLLVGALITIATPSTASKVTTASLTAIGGLLSGYIAKTFLETHARANRQLNFYFQQPLVTSYLLSAQRLIGEMSSKDKKDPALSGVITRMMDVLDRLPLSGGDLDGGQQPKVKRPTSKHGAAGTDSETGN